MIFTILNGVAYGSLLFLLAAGLTMTFGVLKIVNLAHGSMFLLAAYVALSVQTATGSFVLAFLCGCLLTLFLGIVLERTVLYRLHGNYLYQVLLTLGLLLIISDVTLMIWGGTPRTLSPPEWLAFSIPMGNLTYPAYRVSIILIGLIMAVGMWFLFERTRSGARIRAAVDDEPMARSVGISVKKLRMTVFGLGSLLAGAAGVLGGPIMGISSGLDLEVFLLALVVVIVGGVGSLPGAYVAALFIGVIDTYGKTFLPELSMFLVFAPMLIVLAIRPTGLFGRPLVDEPGESAPVKVNPRAARIKQGIQSFRQKWPLKWPRWLWPTVIVGLLLLSPFVTSPYLTGVFTLALIWALFAFGLNILAGYTGSPSLGHAAFFGSGAYTAALLGNHLSLGITGQILSAIIFSALLAAVVGLIALRTRTAYFLLVMIAVGQVLWAVAFKWRSLTGGDDGMTVSGSLSIGWLEQLVGHGNSTYYIILVLSGLVICFGTLLLRSPFGQILIGVRDNEQRMASLGYNTWLYRYLAFILSGAIGGLAGALYALYNTFVDPGMLSVITSAEVLLMVILGGAGTIFGPVIGAFAIIFLEEWLSGFTMWWQIYLGLVYILVVLVAPHGLVGLYRSWIAPPSLVQDGPKESATKPVVSIKKERRSG